MKVERGSVWGILAALGKLQIGTKFLLSVTVGLNNQRLGAVLLL
jgi:hypothetical protein